MVKQVAVASGTAVSLIAFVGLAIVSVELLVAYFAMSGSALLGMSTVWAVRDRRRGRTCVWCDGASGPDASAPHAHHERRRHERRRALA